MFSKEQLLNIQSIYFGGISSILQFINMFSGDTSLKVQSILSIDYLEKTASFQNMR